VSVGSAHTAVAQGRRPGPGRSGPNNNTLASSLEGKRVSWRALLRGLWHGDRPFATAAELAERCRGE
jgi:hypothetical protein